MPQTRPVEFAKAFVLNVVFFIAGIAIYMRFVSTASLHLGALGVMSLLLLGTRLRQIRVEESTAFYLDEALFLSVLDDYLLVRDRWTLVEERLDYRRYEARVFVGLYRFTAALEVYPQDEHARLRGHYRVLGGLVRALNRPHIATIAPAR